MFDLEIDENSGDLVIPMRLVAGIEQIRQEVASRLRFFRGEFFLDTTVGVAYYGGILEKGSSRYLVEAELKNTITNTPGVDRLISFRSEFDASKRIYTVVFTAQTTAGIIDSEVSI